jgi:ACR3 family arsenite transporter
MAFFAWLFKRIIWSPFISTEYESQYTAGMILLGVAPCTAMVLVWSYLSKGNMVHTLVMVAINSLSMLFLNAPLAGFLLGVASNHFEVAIVVAIMLLGLKAELL